MSLAGPSPQTAVLKSRREVVHMISQVSSPAAGQRIVSVYKVLTRLAMMPFRAELVW
jgi:hypothetical protein